MTDMSRSVLDAAGHEREGSSPPCKQYMQQMKLVSSPMMAEQNCLIAALALSKGVLPVQSFLASILMNLRICWKRLQGLMPLIWQIFCCPSCCLLMILPCSPILPLISKGSSKLLQEFCAARGLTVNVKKTKILVFEHRKSTTPAFLYGGKMTLSRSMSSNILAC